MVLRPSEIVASKFSDGQLRILSAVGITYDGANKPDNAITGRIRIRTSPTSSRWLSTEESSYVAPDSSYSSDNSGKVPVIRGYARLSQGIKRGDFTDFDMFYLASAAASGLPKVEGRHTELMRGLEGKVADASLRPTSPEFAEAFLAHIRELRANGHAPVYDTQFAEGKRAAVDAALTTAKAEAMELYAIARSILHEDQRNKTMANARAALEAAVNGNYLAGKAEKLSKRLAEVRAGYLGSTNGAQPSGNQLLATVASA